MKLSIGIVGLPNVGKSTLFKVITKQEILIANYPFATIDPNVGIVPVPDERLAKLTEISKSKKTVPAVVEFYDIAGLVKGANEGAGLGNQFLSHIRECKAIVHVVRCFKSDDIIHVEGGTDPLRDIEIIELELALKDLDTVKKRIGKFESEIKAGDKHALENKRVLMEVQEKLQSGKLIQEYADLPIMKEIQLLMSKKQLFLLNGSREDVSVEVFNKIKELGGDYIISDLALADNIDPIRSRSEATDVQGHPASNGASGASSVNQLIKKAYEILDLISFFTTGEDETRAWTIQRGAKAPEAAGTIHTDFEHKFIRAEVVSYEDLMEIAGGPSAGSAGSPQASSGVNPWNQAKQKGKLRLEGKDYIVQDGDVIVVRHG